MNRFLILATEVTRRPLRWVWPNRIPSPAITILEGDPGHGKSAITYDVTARVTSGRPMPDCEERTTPAGVVLLQAEDSLPSTVLPNLHASGADLARVALFDKERFLDDPLAIPSDIPLIEEAVLQVGARLVVIDPLTAFLPTNANGDVGMRRFLSPLVALAERRDLAVLVVRHLRKSATGNSLYAGAGSIGIIAAARSALFVGHDPGSDDKYQHVLAVNKSNLADAPSLAYRTVRHADGTITVEWLGPSEYTATDVAAAPNDAGQQTALRDAMYVLYSILSEGGLPANEVIRVAKTAGITERTLKRAKYNLRVLSKKRGSGRDSQWFWHLPDDEGLYQPLKDKDLGDLIDRLIYGDEDLASPQGRKKQRRNPSGEDEDHRRDDGDAGRPIR